MGYLLWALVIAHARMALFHSLAGGKEVLGVLRLQP
jgi:cytochrome b561